MKHLSIYAFSLLVGAALEAHVPPAMATCARIEDSLERLVCYDRIATEEGVPTKTSCPISFEVEKVGRDFRKTLVLEPESCPEHPFLRFSTATVRWQGANLEVQLGFRNDYRTAQKVILDVAYLKRDGSLVRGGTETADLDAEDHGGVRVPFRVRVPDATAAHLTLRILEE